MNKNISLEEMMDLYSLANNDPYCDIKKAQSLACWNNFVSYLFAVDIPEADIELSYNRLTPGKPNELWGTNAFRDIIFNL